MIASDDDVASWLCTLHVCGYNGVGQRWQPFCVQTENYESSNGYCGLISVDEVVYYIYGSWFKYQRV